MKFLLVIIGICCFSFGLSEKTMDATREIACKDNLENEDFVNKCVNLYCKCFYNCIEIQARGDDELFDLKCVLGNGCVEGDILTINECINCIEDQPEETKHCNGTAVPSSMPSLSSAPSVSLFPSASPSESPSPTLSSAPSVECTCLDCNHTSGCNPDPHYTSWDNSFFDFQGGCDQIAIDNNILQLQIRTRPRGSYSTITEAALKFKLTNEVFRVGVDTGVTNSLTSASGVTYTPSTNTHEISFNNAYSFIRFNVFSYGISIQVFGHGSYFCGSEGMFGSWNNGGVRFPNGTAFDLSGGWAGTRTRSIELAQAWMVPFVDNLLTNPSIICDASSSCGGSGDAFLCTDTRRLRALQQTEPCETTCDDISNDILRGACEEDVELTADEGWACQPSYTNPVIIEADTCDFEKPDEGMCYSVGDTCAQMDGYCKPDCEETDTHVCLPGICGSDMKIRNLKKDKKDKKEESKSKKSLKKTKAPIEECMCFAPTKC